jgi:cobalt-zinc-cadmium efflux system outer membrane protein
LATTTKFRSPAAWIALVGAIAAGCRTAEPHAPDRLTVGADLSRRVGHALPERTPPGAACLPPGASFDDGLTEDEAVAVALWNNAAFQELLVDLGLTRGDLIQAGLLPNPELLVYFPAPDKPIRYLFDFALESLWLRPIRLEIAAARPTEPPSASPRPGST